MKNAYQIIGEAVEQVLSKEGYLDRQALTELLMQEFIGIMHRDVSVDEKRECEKAMKIVALGSNYKISAKY